MTYPQRNFKIYDAALLDLERRDADRRARAGRERFFDGYVRPVLVGAGLSAILVLSQMAARENKEWLERKCEQVYSFIGIPMSTPYEEATEVLD